MQDYNTTPAEEKQMHLDVLSELAQIMQITLKAYKKNPTAELEQYLKHQKETHDIYKQKI